MMQRATAVAAALWLFAIIMGGAFAYRIQHLPPKTGPTVVNGDGQPIVMAAPNGVPPDPGYGPLPVCWVDINYTVPSGQVCPSPPDVGIKP